ncbi:MAG: hypothetical protein AAGB26_13185 [Planctomycetota bacterium]
MYIKIVLTIALILLTGCSDSTPPTPKQSGELLDKLAPGQVWTYQTRLGEEASRVIICLIETEPDIGEVAHIHISNVKIKNRNAPDNITSTIWHLPFSADALQQSLIELESDGAEVPDFQDGYDQWRAAFDNNEGGVWTLPLSETIDAMEEMLDN